MLSFKSPRSYEADSLSDDQEYKVTVQVSDGSKVEYFKAYVTVTDVEETGKVTWIVGPGGSATAGTNIRLQQFRPGAQLRASVTDPDAVTGSQPTGLVADASITSWKWYRGSSLIDGETEATYTVVADDVGERIRVEATYSDGGGAAETVSSTSEHPVQAYSRPGDNTDPAFSPTTVTRRVEENSKGDVGGPVTATDGDGDELTYTLGGTDVASFKIDMATGQLMVGDVKIDYEEKDSYTVTVTATDSFGTPTDPAATVTISVIDVDEKPTFGMESPDGGVVAAQTEGRTVIDTDEDPADAATTTLATFAASDPEGKKVTLSLMGDDAGSFELDVSQVLSFKEKTDYEMPGDRNRDNVYEVTVRASDGTMNADRALIIKVINDAVEGGKVTVTPDDAVVGVELTATLTHMEGGVSASGQIANQMWQWQRAAAPDGGGQTCADVTEWNDIANATDATYTPVPDDRDGEADPVGGCLSAMVTYNYQFAAGTTTAESAGTLVLVSQANQAPKFKEGTSTFRVVAEDVDADDADDADADDDADAAADNVGSPIVATDANGDTPTYTLGGADASLFRIRSNGQIEVKGKLDHEKDSSHTVTVTANDGSGASNDSARITVTIYVTDFDEAPTIKDRADSTAQGERTIPYRENGDGPVATFTASDPEDATPDFWSLTTTAVGDVDADDIADNALFKIDQNGVLSFKSPRSYEADSLSDDQEYKVTVQVSDGNQIGYFKVTVNVTDVEETGKVTWIVGPDGSATAGTDIGLQQFQPGAQLSASVTDPDAVTSSQPTGLVADASITSWKWYRGSSLIDGETEATYIVVADDVGERIRVEATYSDGGGAVETVRFVSENPVQAARPPGDNTDPAFSPTTVTRRVEENSKGDVGGPVTATDGDGDELTYTLGGTDVASFKIDMATGQLMVGDVKIDYEEKDSYTVTVTATDSFGTPTDPAATVTISVIDVDEKPTFGMESPDGGVVAAQTEGRTVIDTDEDPADAATTTLATFAASDPEGKKVTLSLMGDDAGSFELDVSQVLSFKEKTDYEMPGDRNRDNVYEVTVRASDGTMNADRALIIKVINDAVEGGKVTVTPDDAVVGVELTATLTHMEGGVSASGQIANQMWQWQRAAAPDGGGQTCADVTEWNDIANATDATYTPVPDDRDGEADPVGGCLSAMVTYNYQFAAGTTTAESAGTLVLVSQANSGAEVQGGYEYLPGSCGGCRRRRRRRRRGRNADKPPPTM